MKVSEIKEELDKYILGQSLTILRNRKKYLEENNFEASLFYQ